MKHKLLFIVLFILVGVIALPVLAADIIESFTEQQFNMMVAGQTFPTATFTAKNIKVDFKPGKILVKGTLVGPTGGTALGEVLIVPYRESGVVTWSAISGKVNGVTATPTQLAALAEPLTNVWRSYINMRHPGAYINGITITDTTMTINIFHHSHG